MTEPRTDEQEQSYFDSSEMPAASSEEAAERSYFETPEVDDAVPIRSPAPEAVGDTPRYSRQVGTGNAEERFFARTPEEAEEKLDEIAAYCSNCPINHACAEESCAVYRAEQAALKVQDDAEGPDSYAGVLIPAGLGE